MYIDITTIHGVYDSVDGRRVRAFLSVDCDKPSHAAIGAVCETNVSVERDEEGGVCASFAEPTAAGECVEWTAVACSLGDVGWDGTVDPVWVVEVSAHIGVGG